MQPEAPVIDEATGQLNRPPTQAELDALMAEQSPPPPRAQEAMTTGQVDQAINKAAGQAKVPTMDAGDSCMVTLPGGYITPEGLLVTEARVRELNGFDEEKLARTDMLKNAAAFVTEMLDLGVEDLGGEKPSRRVLQSLLSGDRDALMLGIRRATYGNEVEFKLKCPVCDNDSVIIVLLNEDIVVEPMKDPLHREFEIPLRKGGVAIVHLINGSAQEAFSADMAKKTSAEITTVMLAKCVVAINGTPVGGRTEDVLRLPSADRQAITDFLAENQPGPQLNKEIPVPCATCGEEFQILLGIPNLFRW